MLCLLSCPGGKADFLTRGKVWSPSLGEAALRNHDESAVPGQIPATTARNPLDHRGDDEMTSFWLEDHYHCMEVEDWEHFQVPEPLCPPSHVPAQSPIALSLDALSWAPTQPVPN